MGCNISIPAVKNSNYRVQTIFNPEDDLRDLIQEYIGTDARDLYDEVLEECKSGEDVLSPYRTKMRSIADSLNTLLGKKHIKKEEIQNIYDDLLRNL